MDKQQTSYFMLSMVFGAMMGSVVSAYVITTMLKEYGASTFLLALIPVTMPVGMLFSLPVSLMLAKFEPKNVSIFMFSLGRGFLVFYVLAFAFPRLFTDKMLIILFTAYVLMNIIGSSVNGICQSWLKQIIQEGKLGALMGNRSALAAITTGIFTPLIGFAIERHDLMGGNKTTVFLWLMIFAVVTGFIDMWFLARVRGTGVPYEKRPQLTFMEIREAFKNRHLRQVAHIPVLGNLGTLILAPFSILLFYELKFSEGMVALIIAVSTAGLAVGQVLGGHYADRLRVKEVLLGSALITMSGSLAVLIVSLGIFSYGLSIWIACGTMMVATVITSAAGGAFNSAVTKYTFCAVKDNFSVAFAFISLLRSFGMFCISLGVAKAGAVLSEKSDFLAAYLWPGCHYIQLILILSVGASLWGIWYLWRHLYASVFCLNREKAGSGFAVCYNVEN